VIAGLLVRDPAQRITIAQARRLLGGDTAVIGAPAAGSGTGDTVADQATHPGDLAYRGYQTRPGGPRYPDSAAGGRQAGRRRTAVIAGAVAGAVAVAVAAAVVVTTTLHSGSSGGQGAGGTPAISGIAAQGTAADSGTASQATATDSASAAAASSAGTPGATVPAAFAGNWTGTLTDHTGLEGPQTANLTLAGGAVNSVVGTADYPNVGCHYNLRLISSATDEVELYEEIQSGLCYSEYVVLTRSGTGITESVYQSQPGGGQQPEFDGRLTKSTAG
jgi:hypothetical protein